MLHIDLLNTIIQGDSLEVLKTLPRESVNCIITSPPYFGLRDYGMEGQIGLEETPEAYIKRLVMVFREARRILRDDGVLWLNLGDSYAGSGKGQSRNGSTDPKRGKMAGMKLKNSSKGFDGIKQKDLIGIPWMAAFALRADGWYLRQDIIWHKPNCMPESVTDRCTKNHEYVFLLSKSQSYAYDNEAIKEEALYKDDSRAGFGRVHYRGKREGKKGEGQENFVSISDTKNKRSVWTVTTKGYDDAHFATFPEKLIEPMVLAGCPEGGIVLDPFMGAGTTGLVAKKLARNYLGIELNSKYIDIANKRIQGQTAPMVFPTLTPSS